MLNKYKLLDNITPPSSRVLASEIMVDAGGVM